MIIMGDNSGSMIRLADNTYIASTVWGSTSNWYNRTTTYSSGVAYTNTHESPMEVFIIVGGLSSVSLKLDALTVIPTYTWTISRPYISFVVPYFKSYTLTFTASNLHAWLECY